VRALRVAFVAPFGVCRRGTTQARVLPLAAALAARGHQVRVIVPDWDCSHCAERSYQVGSAAVCHLGEPNASRRLISLRLLRRAYRAALEHRPHVLHCFKPIGYSGAVALLAAQLARRAGWAGLLAVDADDLEGPDGWAARTGRPVWQARALGWQERTALATADVVTAASAYLTQRISAWRGDGLAPLYLPNAVELALAAPPCERGVPTEAPILLLYTRFNEFTPARGAAVAAEILRRVREARLVVVGDGPIERRQTFFRELERLGVAHRVTWRGMLTGEALHAVLEADAVALWLFDNNRINVARSPVKLLELMTHGRPLVAEAVGEVPRLAGTGARLVRAGDTAELARQATTLLQDRTERQEQARRARASLAANTWSARAQALDRLYGVQCT
jgi:glycosyltransferase involved in cell wall biosynthesis